MVYPNTILRLSFFIYVKEGILTSSLNISFIELVIVNLLGFIGVISPFKSWLIDELAPVILICKDRLYLSIRRLIEIDIAILIQFV